MRSVCGQPRWLAGWLVGCLVGCSPLRASSHVRACVHAPARPRAHPRSSRVCVCEFENLKSDVRECSAENRAVQVRREAKSRGETHAATASRTRIFLSFHEGGFTWQRDSRGRLLRLFVVVVVIVVVGGTAQRNVARGELAARPVSLTRDEPFRCFSLSSSFLVSAVLLSRESARFRFLSPNCRE